MGLISNSSHPAANAFSRDPAIACAVKAMIGICLVARLPYRRRVASQLALLAPDQTRTQTLECVENGEALHITYEQVKQLYYQNPQFGFYFLQLTSRRLFENISRLETELATCKAASAAPAAG
jgi:CRP-like cAMP-binding protein